MAPGGQMIWHCLNLTQVNFLDSLSLANALQEDQLIISTIIAPSVK